MQSMSCIANYGEEERTLFLVSSLLVTLGARSLVRLQISSSTYSVKSQTLNIFSLLGHILCHNSNLLCADHGFRQDANGWG